MTQTSRRWWLLVVALGFMLGMGLVWWLLPASNGTDDNPLTLTGARELVLRAQQLTRSQSITLRDQSRLVLEDATLTFDLANDLDAGIYLFDNAQLVVRNAILTSTGKMYEIEMRGRSRLETNKSELRNHSAVKLFDDTSLVATDTLVEELRMDDRAQADLTRSEIYPNLQFFESPTGPLSFPPAFQPVTTPIALPGGWSMNLTDTTTQGWQVDIYPGTQITITDSTDVNLGLRSNGQSTATLNLENPSGERTSFQIADLGFDLTVANSEIFFINFYPKGNDQITVRGTPGRTRLLEVVLLDQSQLILEDIHLMAQLAHANDQSQLVIRRSTIGSDDPEDPIRSELALLDEAVGIIEDSDATRTDIRVADAGRLTFLRSSYDSNRITGPVTVLPSLSKRNDSNTIHPQLAWWWEALMAKQQPCGC